MLDRTPSVLLIEVAVNVWCGSIKLLEILFAVI